MRTRRRALGASAAGSLLAIAATGCTGAHAPSAATPQATASSYLSDWSHKDWAGMRRLTAKPPADFTAVNQAAFASLGVTASSFSPGRMRTSGGKARQDVTEHLTLGKLGQVSIETTLHLVNRHGHWLISWTPATITPRLRAGDRLGINTTWPARARILGAGGAPLTTQAPMVVVGLEGRRVKNPASLTKALVAAGATRQEVTTALAAAKAHPTFFEPVYTITWARYQRLKPVIYPLPGTVFQNQAQRTAITPGLAAGIVGTTGPVTAQELAQLGAPYDAASAVGQTGLEGVAERQLAGAPGADVVIVNPAGTTVATVARIPKRPGTPVTTTINPGIQRAAEAALASDTHLGGRTAALVAVNATSGAILAAADVNSNDFDVALEGAYPPGSTFKVITSAALLSHGLTPSSAATCPPAATVEGEVFHNAEGDAPVRDMLHAFAESCNTAFIGLATRHLTAADFPRAARMFRLGVAPHMGLAAYAKTGTAQFGTGKKLKTDAWLIGFRGDIAFAVLVSDSAGNGGPTDGPIAARFLHAIGG